MLLGILISRQTKGNRTTDRYDGNATPFGWVRNICGRNRVYDFRRELSFDCKKSNVKNQLALLGITWYRSRSCSSVSVQSAHLESLGVS